MQGVWDKIMGNPAKRTPPKGPHVNLLVMQGSGDDWPTLMKGQKLENGMSINVVQSSFRHTTVGPLDNYSKDGKVVCGIRKTTVNGEVADPPHLPFPFFPDFCLVRNEVYAPFNDYRNKLYGMMYASLPCMNTLESIFFFTERPIIYGALNKLRKELGDDFPLIDQNFFPDYESFVYGLPFPAVVKVGAAHAGMGKMRVHHHHDMDDMKSVIAVTNGLYSTAEPFLEGEYDLRIQKIGDHIRAYKRTDVSGCWKTNTGTAVLEDIPVTKTYKIWAEAAGSIFGGLDICTVDAIHTKDGRDVILEVNGTSSGLGPDHEEEDNKIIRDLLLKRMNQQFCGPPPENNKNDNSSSSTEEPATLPTGTL
eukprot:TRINITY_DN75987_c0_g1_i1.p1 TRINITY_DN75987_c0_g1~~TRINITY_DN75987_c0_g1_i1.p1  ORF type:complete len:396 (-),score=32.14 TRINITY_DN75987_c0_g1_i1:125-1216(-)